MKPIHIFSGHAKLAEGSDLSARFKQVSIYAKIDIRDGKILDCDVPIFFKQSSDFLSEILIGKSLDTDMEAILAEIEESMHVLSKWALISAMQVMYNRYIMFRKQKMPAGKIKEVLF
jgi:hypothetical protein